MNKKNITIDTQFFNDQFDHSLNKYITEQIEPNYMNNSFKDTSFRTKEKQSSLKDSFQNISHTDYQRYQHIPENQYSQTASFYRQATIQPQSKASRQLESANQIQKLLSQAMANLFISCWDSLKGLLYNNRNIQNQPHNQLANSNRVSVQIYQNINQENKSLKKDSVIRPNSSRANNYEAENQFGSKSQNQKSSIFNSEKRKNQIMERQKKGITLDSLEKKKNSKPKSLRKNQFTQNKQENRLINQTKSIQKDLQKSNHSKGSKKSYRQKFQQYKHQGLINGPQKIQNSYRRNVIYANNQNKVRQQNNLHFDYNMLGKMQYSQQNQNPSQRFKIQNKNNSQFITSYKQKTMYDQKNQLLNNINKILQGKEKKYDVNQNYQTNKTVSKKMNLGVDYMDNVNTIHQHNINTLRNLSYSFNNNHSQYLHTQQQRYYHPLSKTQLHVNHDEQEFARARLLEQIVDKLHFSKLKLINEGQNDNNQDLQMIRKLNKLEKLVLQLKMENQKASRVKSEYQQKQVKTKRDYQSQHYSRQEDELFRKFTDQLYTIRNELSLLKNSRPVSQNYGNQQIIIQQQKLLHSFQESLIRLQKIQQSHRQSHRPSFQDEQKSSNPQGQGSGSFLTQLIQANKNKQKKESWNQGWQKTQQKTNLNSQSRRQIDLRSRDNLTNYRYTRNQILSDMGKKQQIQEQERRVRQQQQRLRYEKQRKFTKIVRRQENDEDLIIKKRPIRQIYESEWAQYQKKNIDVDYGKCGCCSLFPC